jgi:diguanylate cyclase (GGDEF)-like protein
VLLGLCWLPSYLLGGESVVPPLWFFVPIVLAATRSTFFALVVALLSGLLAGPLTPAYVEYQVPQSVSEWVVRTAFFAGVACITSGLFSRLRREAAEHRAAREAAEEQALRDPLTGLPNRALLQEHLASALARAKRSGKAVVLVYVDLDDFKLVNDSLGHAAGDDMLRAVAARLDVGTRGGDVLARQGGDEFLLMLTDVDAADATTAAHAVVERVTSALEQPITIGEAELQVTASLGVSVFPGDAHDPDTLMRHADAAMYRAKAAASGWALYEPSQAEPLARMSLAARLRRAIEDDELELHFQPVFALRDDSILGVEALVRWNDPERGLVPPADFITTAEQTGVIDALGDWVLRATCEQLHEWAADGLRPHMGVNLSPYQLRRPGFAARTAAIVAEHGLEPRRIVFELTESAWTLEADRTHPVLEELKAAGFGLALDDFGAGYSSLHRLLELPFDIVKVDRALLRDVPERDDAVAVLTAIQRLAEACDCDVVAEGVETSEQLALLRRLGCRLAQGYGLARPAPAGEITPLLRDGLVTARRA